MRLKIFVTILILLTILICTFLYFNNQSAWNTAFTWSGIKSLPSWSINRNIEIRGTTFSREFIITFNGTKEQIEEWVKTETVLKDIKTEDLGNLTYRYVLKPQNGAQWAEIKIDLIQNKVTIRTYWS